MMWTESQSDWTHTMEFSFPTEYKVVFKLWSKCMDFQHETETFVTLGGYTTGSIIPDPVRVD